MHANIDELIHVCLEGPMVELLTRVDPDMYLTYMIEEKGKMVLYVKLTKGFVQHITSSIVVLVETNRVSNCETWLHHETHMTDAW